MSAQVQSSPMNSAFEDYIVNAIRVISAIGDVSVFADHKVSLAEWTVLRTIAVAGGSMDNSSLLRETGLSRQRVRELVRSVQAAGLINVAQTDGDKRRRVLQLTDKAREILASISSGLHQMEQSIRQQRPEAIARSNQIGSRMSKAIAKAANAS